MNNSENNNNNDEMQIEKTISQTDGDATAAADGVNTSEKVSSDDKLSDTASKDLSKKKEKKKMNLAVKILLIILCVLLAVIVVLAVTITVMHYVGKDSIFNDNSGFSINIDDEPGGNLNSDSKPGDASDKSTGLFGSSSYRPGSSLLSDVEDSGKIITYKSKQYHLNESIITMLLIGVDKSDELGIVDNTIGTAGDADALYLVAIDTDKNQFTTFGLSRDTITDVDIYSTAGVYMGQKPMQICLSYAYGDGFDSSCKNTIKSVSRVLYGLDINLYFAIYTDAVGAINDKIGGVTVTPSMTFTVSQTGTTYTQGVPVTLYGEDAEMYVRYRDVSSLDSNNGRMQRQRDYISAFTDQLISATKSDLSVPLDIYQDVKSYSATNLTASKLTYLVTESFMNGTPTMQTKKISGRVVKEGNYAAFYPDEESLVELLVDVFYVPLDEYNK